MTQMTISEYHLTLPMAAYLRSNTTTIHSLSEVEYADNSVENSGRVSKIKNMSIDTDNVPPSCRTDINIGIRCKDGVILP